MSGQPTPPATAPQMTALAEWAAGHRTMVIPPAVYRQATIVLCDDLAARKDPTKFADLAKAKSDGPSGAKGGSLGKWVKGMMVPAFDKAIGEMKIGDISEPIETPFGFHIITRQDPAKVQ